MKIIDRRSAFTEIQAAWKIGRPLVPVYGAGVSISAGVASTPALVEYFARYRYLRDRIIPIVGNSTILGRPRRRRSHKGQFAVNDWPNPHQLNEDLLSLACELSTSEEAVHQQSVILNAAVQDLAIAEQYRRIADISPALQSMSNVDDQKFDESVRKIYVEWHKYLHAGTQGRPAKIDSFFDNLTNNRKPSKAHVFNSLLTKFLDIRLVLTTNFDDLIESALAQDGVAAKVYEITYPDSTVPDVGLVHSNRSIVKLHGGTHGLRADESLSDEFEPHVASTITSYVPDDALMIVIGYGGADRRVMSLLESIIDKTSSSLVDSRLVWVARDQPSGSLKDFLSRTAPRSCVCNCRDGGLFLQELYSEISRANPVRKKPYQLLPNEPVWIPRIDPERGGGSHSVTSDPLEAALDKSSKVIIFRGDQPGDGTSTALARYHRNYSNECIAIWIDLEEFSSCDSVLAVLYDEIRRYDHNLPAIVISKTGNDSFEISARKRRIIQALRRGSYAVCFDSLGEFCASSATFRTLPDKEAISSRVRQYREFLDFLAEVARKLHPREGGLSRVAIALSETWVSTADVDDIATMGTAVDQEADKSVLHIVTSDFIYTGQKDESIDVVNVRSGRGRIDWSERALKLERSVLGTLAVSDDQLEQDPPQTESAQLENCPYSSGVFRRLVSGGTIGALLSVASLIRRPRSRWDLVATVEELTGDDPCRVESLLTKLEELEILIRQEGGFLWMSREIRRRFRDATSDARTKKEVCALHECIARCFYEDIFLPSRDISAFFEYMYHRSLSAQVRDPKLSAARLGNLVETLERSWDYLLSKGHAALIVEWLQDLKRIADRITAYSHSSRGINIRQAGLRGRLTDLEAEVKREASDYIGCIIVRIGQIRALDIGSISGIELPRRVVDLEKGADAVRETRTVVHSLARSLFRTKLEPLLLDSKKGLELSRFLLDIGVCCKGIGCFKQSRLMLGQSLRVAGAVEKRVDDRLRDVANKIQIKICYRLMDLKLWSIDPWRIQGSAHTDAHVRARIAVTLDGARRHFIEGIRRIKLSPGLGRSDAGRYRSFYFTLMCRLNNLEAYVAKMDKAIEADAKKISEGLRSSSIRWLKKAESAMFRGDGVRSKSVRGVCELHRAEGLLMIIRQLRHTNRRDWRKQGRNLLNRISGALCRAESHLADSTRGVWWWTLLCHLDAGMHYETAHYVIRGHSGSNPGNSLSRGEESVFECLCSVGAGLDNVGYDFSRAEILIYTAKRAKVLLKDVDNIHRPSRRGGSDEDKFEKAWTTMFFRAGLGWLLGDDALAGIVREVGLFSPSLLSKASRANADLRNRAETMLARNFGGHPRWEAICSSIWGQIEGGDGTIALSNIETIAQAAGGSSEDVLAVLALFSKESFRILDMGFKSANDSDGVIELDQVVERLKSWWKHKESSEEEWRKWARGIDVAWTITNREEDVDER